MKIEDRKTRENKVFYINGRKSYESSEEEKNGEQEFLYIKPRNAVTFVTYAKL